MRCRPSHTRYAAAVCYMLLVLSLVLTACDLPFRSSPSIAQSPAVYAFEGIGTSSRPYNVVALSINDGHVLWRHKFSGTGTLKPFAVGTAVYATSYHDTATVYHQGVLEALRASDGTPLWQHLVASPILMPPAVVNDVIYVSSSRREGGLEAGGLLEALHVADGTPLWQARLPGMPSSALIVGGMVYVLSVGSPSVLFAFDKRNGKPVWTYQSDVPFSVGETGPATPLITDYSLYVEVVNRATDGGAQVSLLAFNLLDGTLRWSYPTGGLARLPAIAGDTIYITSDNVSAPSASTAGSVIAAVNTQDGTARWTYATAPHVYLSPPVADVNGVYVAVGTSSLTSRTDGGGHRAQSCGW
jgi:outer membrane protein assembly factor BamB